jgi:hypothetical protein
MKQIGLVTFVGKSGTEYGCKVYLFEDIFDEIKAVYIITRFIGGAHTVLYVGHTENLRKMLSSHPRYACMLANGANRICVHQEEDMELRRMIVNDLIQLHDPLCNYG